MHIRKALFGAFFLEATGTFFPKSGYPDFKQGIAMGQIYHLNSENDELLSEAEKAFDLSARRQAMLKSVRDEPETPHRKPVLKALAGLLVPVSHGLQN